MPQNNFDFLIFVIIDSVELDDLKILFQTIFLSL